MSWDSEALRIPATTYAQTLAATANGQQEFRPMINKANGFLKISPEIELAPFGSFEDIAKLKLGEIQKTRDMKNGYKWLDAKNVKIDNEYYNLSFGFHSEELEMLIFIVDDKKFDLEDDWTEEKEKSKEQKYKEWVINKLGRDGQFSWGQVSAEYDPKSGSSSILINYGRTSKGFSTLGERN